MSIFSNYKEKPSINDLFDLANGNKKSEKQFNADGAEVQTVTEKFIFAQPISTKKPSEQALRVAHEIKRSSTAAKAYAFGEVNVAEDGLEIAYPRQLENDVDER